MAEKYKRPDLCNYYCANQCPIGQEYVPEVSIRDLSQIVLEMLASFNAMNKRKDRLIEITADGMITPRRAGGFCVHPGGAGAHFHHSGDFAALGRENAGDGHDRQNAV